MFDLGIIETGNGGDLQLQSRGDLAVVNSIENMVYLALFGGNKQSTKPPASSIPPGSKNYDWWGNNLFYLASSGQQFNSNTERVMNSVELSSNGRLLIQNAINDDLKFLSDKATITVDVKVISDDVVNINIKVVYNDELKIIIINFKKQALTGEFSILDFSTDFD
jgi:phage gp46-like protein